MNLERTKRCKHYEDLLHQKNFPILSHETYNAESFSFKQIEEIGFDCPFIVKGNHANFGLELPPKDWTLRDIAAVIGNETNVRIIDVGTQSEMHGFTIGQYADYLAKNSQQSENYQNARILNMISLEVSNSRLSDMVTAPKFVDLIDWVSLMWPLDRIARNDYPRVQKYCLAGMAGSYTDFHIDFGGTSVWYHILWGRKRFFLIPPTSRNLEIFEEWSCSRKQSKVFLGDKIPEQCYTLDLLPNETLIIPSGWIHAVFTPDDSLVFGGNFLCSHSILRQLQAFNVEARCKIDNVFMFPYFKQINFCFLINFYEENVIASGIVKDIGSCVILQIPFMLAECEIWLCEKRFKNELEIFLHGKPYSQQDLMNGLWEYLEGLEILRGKFEMVDLRNGNYDSGLENRISREISSLHFRSFSTSLFDSILPLKQEVGREDEEYQTESGASDDEDFDVMVRENVRKVSKIRPELLRKSACQAQSREKRLELNKDAIWNICKKQKRK